MLSVELGVVIVVLGLSLGFLPEEATKVGRSVAVPEVAAWSNRREISVAWTDSMDFRTCG